MGGVHREENLEHQRCLYLHRKWPLKRPHLECPDFGFPRPSSDVPKESFELGSDMLVEPKSTLHITLWETILKPWILTMIPTKPVMLNYLTFSGTTTIHAQKIKGSICLPFFYHDEEQKELALKTFDEAKKQRNRPIATEIAPATEFTDAENYHQKYLLQHHPWLLESLEIHPGDHLIQSHVAARLNGYIGGYGNVKDFNIEAPQLGLNEKMMEYVARKMKSKY